MLVPMFSVGFYISEKQYTVYDNLASEEVYDKIPGNELSEFNRLNRDEINHNMARLLVDESFRVIWHNSNPTEQYILITKTGFRQDNNLLISPDSLDEEEETQDNNNNQISTLGADKMQPVQFINNINSNPSMVQRMSKVKLPNSPDSDDEKKPYNYYILCNRNLNFIFGFFKKIFYMESKPILPI